MVRRNLSLSLAAALAAACLSMRGGPALLCAAALPVLAHELSHVIALRLLGLRVTGFSIDVRGPCIRYDGVCGPAGQIAAALAGPLGGALYALAGRSGIAWLERSASLSLLLTAFNLLPLLPLDGGRAFYALCVLALGEERGGALCRALGRALLALLLTGGVILAAWKKSTMPLAAGIWLLLSQNDAEALVNPGKII